MGGFLSAARAEVEDSLHETGFPLDFRLLLSFEPRHFSFSTSQFILPWSCGLFLSLHKIMFFSALNELEIIY